MVFAKISFLPPQYTFCCCIMKRGHTGVYELTSIIIIGPSSPPTNFRLFAMGPDSVGVSWDPPPLEAQNGNIIAYTLTCQPEELLEALPTTYPTAGNYSLSGFSPATTYNCTLYATSAGGSGPPALQTVTLFDDGMVITISHKRYIMSCL